MFLGKHVYVMKDGQLSENNETEANSIDLNTIESRILDISTEIDLIQSEQIPEFKRLKLISSLRILQSRTQLALSSLNTSASNFGLISKGLKNNA